MHSCNAEMCYWVLKRYQRVEHFVQVGARNLVIMAIFQLGKIPKHYRIALNLEAWGLEISELFRAAKKYEGVPNFVRHLVE